MKYPIPFPATIKCRAANIILITINAIPYNTFFHCIFNFIQALLSYEGLGHFPTSNFTGQNTEVGTRFLCLL